MSDIKKSPKKCKKIQNKTFGNMAIKINRKIKNPKKMAK